MSKENEAARAVQWVVRDLRKRVREFGAKEAIFARARAMAKADGLDFYEALGRLGQRGGKKTGMIKRAAAGPKAFQETEEMRAKRLGDLERRGLW